MINAIVKEIASRKNQITGEITTIYFGGGTPSLLSNDDLSFIIDALYKNYSIANKIEFTLECNPDDLSKKKLNQLKNLGINRLSIGVQSFNNDELIFFKRAHNSKEAETSIKQSQDAGFKNITIDLIYGSPLLTEEIWLENLKKAFELSIPHLSAYSLTIEPKTELGHLSKRNKTFLLNDEKTILQFKTLMQKAKEFGLNQYEVSNFGKKEYYSQHNSNYWKGIEYIGFGPSAHSFIGNKRIWNITNNIKYMNLLKGGGVYFEEEIIDEKTAYNEYILTRLRTIWGVEIEFIKTNFSKKIYSHFEQELKSYLNSPYIQQINNKVMLTDQGVLITDKISSDLFYVE
jgi:oxygen-independent coproporphyrinogen-3 oxidase